MTAEESVAVSQITYVETHAALARMLLTKRLKLVEMRQKTNDFKVLWEELVVVTLETSLLERAAQLSQDLRLRAYDSVQLASALHLKDVVTLSFGCFDEELAAAAAQEGLSLAISN